MKNLSIILVFLLAVLASGCTKKTDDIQSEIMSGKKFSATLDGFGMRLSDEVDANKWHFDAKDLYDNHKLDSDRYKMRYAHRIRVVNQGFDFKFYNDTHKNDVVIKSTVQSDGKVLWDIFTNEIDHKWFDFG